MALTVVQCEPGIWDTGCILTEQFSRVERIPARQGLPSRGRGRGRGRERISNPCGDAPAPRVETSAAKQRLDDGLEGAS
jgi:hypothetical protein